MENMTYQILIIDDSKDYTQEFITFAIEYAEVELNTTFKFIHALNLAQGLKFLKENYFHAVILDAKCLVSETQEVEDFNFLPQALEALKEYEQITKRHIPFVVNTGYIGERELKMMDASVAKQKGKLFRKMEDSSNLLIFLLTSMENAQDIGLEKEYQDVFEIFERGFLSIELKTDLMNILKKLDDKTDIKNKFNSLRKIIEAIYLKIKADNNTIPDNVFYGRDRTSVNLDWCWLYLSGKQVIIDRRANTIEVAPANLPFLFPEHISNLIKCFQEVTAINSHSYPKNVDNYAYKSMLFALLEVLIWFKSSMEQANITS
ncbi:MAG: hypothetical protein EAZ85_03345 [Bacteroidetes bacterium]|nr:MAG: hypothetical protein EAZ85_03345 [Bacteroidota bacterium]